MFENYISVSISLSLKNASIVCALLTNSCVKQLTMWQDFLINDNFQVLKHVINDLLVNKREALVKRIIARLNMVTGASILMV